MQQVQSIAPRRVTSRRLWSSLTLDHLWVATILGLAALFISVLPLPPNDLWWHMAAGRTMVDEGAWLQTNRWAYTLPYDAPYVYQSWLSEVLLYWLWRIGDVPLLVLMRTLVITASYGLVAWHALRRTGQGKAVALALLFAVLIGWNNWTLRPQTLALLPGAAFVVVLDAFLIRRASARWLVALPLLMVLWVNLHGSFILGAALLALAWFGSAVSAIRRPHGADHDQWRLRALMLVGFATLLATMVHPLGVGVFPYVRDLLTDTPSQTRIVEWQPPTNAFSLTNTGFWFFLLVVLLPMLVARGRRRATATDLLWFAALAWLTIGGVRYAMWFALALLPFYAEQFGSLLRERRSIPTSARFATSFGLLFAAMFVATLPWFGPGRYLGPEAERLFANAGPHRMLLSNTTPVAATDWLARHPLEGRFWVDMSYSSYTIWELPEKQVFADLRVDMFPDAIWEDYFTIAQGDQRSLALLDQWQITHLMLDRHGQAALAQLLTTTPGWCEVYGDSNTVIIARCDQ